MDERKAYALTQSGKEAVYDLAYKNGYNDAIVRVMDALRMGLIGTSTPNMDVKRVIDGKVH